MTTVINCERDSLDFDPVPDFLKDSLPTREAAVSMSSQALNEREVSRNNRETLLPGPEAPKSDELEALWPGVHHDFEHAPRKPAASMQPLVSWQARRFRCSACSAIPQ